MSTVRAAEKGMKEELQEKIQIKQEEAAKRQLSRYFLVNTQPILSPRHAEYLEQIQQKAWELSLQRCTSDQGVPVIKPYIVAKKCEVKLPSQNVTPDTSPHRCAVC